MSRPVLQKYARFKRFPKLVPALFKMHLSQLWMEYLLGAIPIALATSTLYIAIFEPKFITNICLDNKSSVLLACISGLVLSSVALTLMQEPVSQIAKLGPGFGTLVISIRAIWIIGIFSVITIGLNLFFALSNPSNVTVVALIGASLTLISSYWWLYKKLMLLNDQLIVGNLLKKKLEKVHKKISKHSRSMSQALTGISADMVREDLIITTSGNIRRNLSGLISALHQSKTWIAKSIWEATSYALRDLNRSVNGNMATSYRIHDSILNDIDRFNLKLKENHEVELYSQVLLDLTSLFGLMENSHGAIRTRQDLTQFFIEKLRITKSEDLPYTLVAINAIKNIYIVLLAENSYLEIQMFDFAIANLLEEALNSDERFLIQELNKFSLTNLSNYMKIDQSNDSRLYIDNWISSVRNAFVTYMFKARLSILFPFKHFFRGFEPDGFGLQFLIYSAKNEIEIENLEYLLVEFGKSVVFPSIHSANLEDQIDIHRVKDLFLPYVALAYQRQISKIPNKNGHFYMSEFILGSILELSPSQVHQILNSREVIKCIWSILIAESQSIESNLKTNFFHDTSNRISELGRNSIFYKMLKNVLEKQNLNPRVPTSEAMNIEAEIRRMGLMEVESNGVINGYVLREELLTSIASLYS